MAVTREIGSTDAGGSRGLELARPRNWWGLGLGWKIVGLAVVALVVAEGISLWPDFARYLKIHNM
jgi:hypothetical protein